MAAAVLFCVNPRSQLPIPRGSAEETLEFVTRSLCATVEDLLDVAQDFPAELSAERQLRGLEEREHGQGKGVDIDGRRNPCASTSGSTTSGDIFVHFFDECVGRVDYFVRRKGVQEARDVEVDGPVDLWAQRFEIARWDERWVGGVAEALFVAQDDFQHVEEHRARGLFEARVEREGVGVYFNNAQSRRQFA